MRAEVAHCYGFNGHVSVDPVVLVKLRILLFLEDIPGERELMARLGERLDHLGFLRSEVGKQLGMRHVPTLTFIPDALPENARHLDDVDVPMLFLQGTRDELASLELLQALVQRHHRLRRHAIVHRPQAGHHAGGATGEEGAHQAHRIVGRAMGVLSQYTDGLIFAIVPPAVAELGNATGFDIQIVDETGIGHQRLMAARNQMLGMTKCSKCGGHFVSEPYENARHFVCGLCEPPARAGKGGGAGRILLH